MKNFKKIAQLQSLKQGEELSLLKSDFGGFQQKVTFNDLVLAKRNRNISFIGNSEEELPFEINHQVGGIDFHGYKSSYEFLGLLLFQLLFSQENYIHIKLTRAQSQIQHLFLHVDRTVTKDFSLKQEPLVVTEYTYFREVVEKFPFSGNGFSERIVTYEDCPVFTWGWSEKNHSYQENRQELADQLILTMTIDGICAIATLFLDMAATENKSDEICLEHSTLGFGGTGINSIEARFWLPNSFGFYCESLDDFKI